LDFIGENRIYGKMGKLWYVSDKDLKKFLEEER